MLRCEHPVRVRLRDRRRDGRFRSAADSRSELFALSFIARQPMLDASALSGQRPDAEARDAAARAIEIELLRALQIVARFYPARVQTADGDVLSHISDLMAVAGPEQTWLACEHAFWSVAHLVPSAHRMHLHGELTLWQSIADVVSASLWSPPLA